MSETTTTLFEMRPQGACAILEEGSGYKVKRIEVLTGKPLSCQRHSRRAGHCRPWCAGRRP